MPSPPSPGPAPLPPRDGLSFRFVEGTERHVYGCLGGKGGEEFILSNGHGAASVTVFVTLATGSAAQVDMQYY